MFLSSPTRHIRCITLEAWIWKIYICEFLSKYFSCSLFRALCVLCWSGTFICIHKIAFSCYFVERISIFLNKRKMYHPRKFYGSPFSRFSHSHSLQVCSYEKKEFYVKIKGRRREIKGGLERLFLELFFLFKCLSRLTNAPYKNLAARR